MQRVFMTIVFMLTPVVTAKSDGELKTEPPASVEAIREKYAKLPCKVLTISEPVQVTNVYYWKDGGSIGLVLKDAKMTEHRFCWDGSKVGPFPLLLGVKSPRDAGGKEVAKRGPEESELYAVMLRWVNKHPSRDAFFDSTKEIGGTKPPRLWEIRAFFLRLDRDFTDFEPSKK